jgi:hypothetical protein
MWLSLGVGNPTRLVFQLLMERKSFRDETTLFQKNTNPCQLDETFGDPTTDTSEKDRVMFTTVAQVPKLSDRASVVIEFA